MSTTVENDATRPFGGANPNAGPDHTIRDLTAKQAFERYIAAGGGYVGIHAASDGDYTWDWYRGLVGAMFKNHVFPPGTYPRATVHIEDAAHPSTQGLPSMWGRGDEWSNFQSNPRDSVHVLASLDETTYDPQTGMPPQDHPISWCHEYKGGRAFYTAMGHDKEHFCEPFVMSHILGGILYAAEMKPGDCAIKSISDAGGDG